MTVYGSSMSNFLFDGGTAVSGPDCWVRGCEFRQIWPENLYDEHDHWFGVQVGEL